MQLCCSISYDLITYSKVNASRVAMACVRRVAWEFDNDVRFYEEELTKKFDAFEVDGVMFFQLDPWSKALIEVVGPCDAVTVQSRGRKTLSRSTAIREMTVLRNRASEMDTVAKRGVIPPTHAKPTKTPRSKLVAARCEGITIVLTLPGVGIELPMTATAIKYVHKADRVALELTPEVLARVIVLIRHSGVEDSGLHVRDDTLPKGVWKICAPRQEPVPSVEADDKPRKKLMVVKGGRFVSVDSAEVGAAMLISEQTVSDDAVATSSHV